MMRWMFLAVLVIFKAFTPTLNETPPRKERMDFLKWLPLVVSAASLGLSAVSYDLGSRSFEASQRSWLKLSLEQPVSLKITHQNAELDYRFKLENVGHSPALQIWYVGGLYLEAAERVKTGEAVRRLCNDLGPSLVNPVAFPGESQRYHFSAYASRKDVDAAEKMFAKNQQYELIGCVRYHDSVTGREGRTGFSRWVRLLVQGQKALLNETTAKSPTATFFLDSDLDIDLSKQANFAE